MSSKNLKKKITPNTSAETFELKNFQPINLKKNNKQTSNLSKDSKSTLPNVLVLSKKSTEIIFLNRKLFGKIIAIYFLLTLTFVRGFSSTVNVVQLKNNYLSQASFKHSLFHSSMSVLGNIVGSGLTNSTGLGNIYQTVLFVIFSLVFIWTLRELLKSNKISTRDSLYKSQFPLIPFLIVSFFIILEFIPMLLGLFLYTTVFSNGIAVNLVEKIIWITICSTLVLISLYFLISSVFALYIVTLPDIQPIQALRSAWRIVKGRRAIIFRKLIFLPIALAFTVGIISLIFIILIPQIADFVYLGLLTISLLLIHSYLYNLYRELI